MNTPFFILSGNEIRFTFTFRDTASVLTDPTTVTCEVGMSDADAVPLTPVKDSTGVYHADWDTTGANTGDYYCKCVGRGALIAAREIKVKVSVPHLTG